jgi:hypothetical protein
VRRKRGLLKAHAVVEMWRRVQGSALGTCILKVGRKRGHILTFAGNCI